MSMFQIVMRLARNSGFPNGDLAQGYTLVAPLDSNGKLDAEEWKEAKGRCTVIRFKPGEEHDADGYLSHRGSNWYFHYDEIDEGDDEPVFKLGDHRLLLGDYVTVHEADGKDLTYRVTQNLPLATIKAIDQASEKPQ
ncbi:MAG TPA: hypothetical protein PLN33_07165 [Hyphomonadaceae bacterium]|nr:hypothetical protein [Hyphomonadaceae bacterium]HPN04282.1 hypothetical protein [Hyphomonadaceae bacterium]